jgi:predicted nucleic acid-binding protein
VSGLLLDTNIPSEAMKPRPEPKVERWLDEVEDEQLFFSVISLAEIFKGIGHLPDSKKRAELQEWVETVLRPFFAGRLLAVTEPIAVRLGLWTGQAKARGIKIEMADGLIAATAIEHGLTLVTRNVKDFSYFGVPLLNPWDAV